MNGEIHWGRRGKWWAESRTQSKTQDFCYSRAGRSCLNFWAQLWCGHYTGQRAMDSVLENSRPRAVKAQGNSVGPVGVKTGKRNLKFAVWTQVQYFNRIICKMGIWEGLNVETRMSVEFSLRTKVWIIFSGLANYSSLFWIKDAALTKIMASDLAVL